MEKEKPAEGAGVRGGLTMRKKHIRETVRIEIAENALPVEEALTQMAKVIAAGMFAEEQHKREKKV